MDEKTLMGYFLGTIGALVFVALTVRSVVRCRSL